MTVIFSDDKDWDYDDPDDCDEWDDDRDHWDHWEPDPEDAEYARWLEEEAEHFEKVHGGTGICDCRPPVRSRIAWWFREHRGRAASWLRNRGYDDPPF